MYEQVAMTGWLWCDNKIFRKIQNFTLVSRLRSDNESEMEYLEEVMFFKERRGE
jgi:hypothetical protein